MPYVYAQSKDASERGLPMVRALFIEYPDDPGSWQVDDEYLFGSDILVAPLMETATTGRDVCLPPDNVLRRIEAARRDGAFTLAGDPLEGKAKSTVRLY